MHMCSKVHCRPLLLNSSVCLLRWLLSLTIPALFMCWCTVWKGFLLHSQMGCVILDTGPNSVHLNMLSGAQKRLQKVKRIFKLWFGVKPALFQPLFLPCKGIVCSVEPTEISSFCSSQLLFVSFNFEALFSGPHINSIFCMVVFCHFREAVNSKKNKIKKTLTEVQEAKSL